MRIFILISYALLALGNNLLAVGIGQKGKVLEFGWDMPDVPYLEKHLEEAEKTPFDGVVIDLGRRNKWSGFSKRQLGFAWKAWQKGKISQELMDDVKSDIAMISKINSDLLSESFILFNANPGGVDWFDEEGMSNVVENWRFIAKAVKKCGMKGIFFDIEYYAKRPGPGWRPCIWSFKALNKVSGLDFEKYQKQVFKQAVRIMSTIKQENPDITIIFTFGNELLYGNTQRGIVFDRYSLLPSFIDGFIKEAGPGIRIVDGYEKAYGFKSAVSFRTAKKLIYKCSSFSKYPKLYRKKIEAGFGLFVDLVASSKWHTEIKNFKKNFYTPSELAFAIQQGLKNGSYVWLYSHKINWWNKKNCPVEYLDAINKAKKKVSVKIIEHSTRKILPFEPSYSSVINYIKKSKKISMFEMDLKNNFETFALPLKWKFMPDPKKLGRLERWFSKSSKLKWHTITVPEWWNCKGSKWERYQGDAWYQVKVSVAEVMKNKKKYLLFTGIDEEADIWLNSKLSAEYNLASGGWNLPFVIDIPKDLNEFLLTIKVNGGDCYAGIWGSVYIIISRKNIEYIPYLNISSK